MSDPIEDMLNGVEPNLEPEPEQPAPTAAAAPAAEPETPAAPAAEPAAARFDDASLRQVNGLLGELREERSKRQLFEAQMQALAAQVEALRGQRGTPESPAVPADPLAGLDDNDVLTAGQFRAAQQRLQETMQQTLSQREQQSLKTLRQERMQAIVAQAARKYTPATAGEGLDFDSVRQAAAHLLTAADDAAILAAADPVEEAYQICLARAPQLRQRFIQAQVQREVQKALAQIKTAAQPGATPVAVPRPGATPRETLAATADAEAASFESLLAMNEDQLDALLQKETG
ncbi:MAG: hypothetical protein WC485_12160 [Opitutaceae bacterium]